MLHGNKSSVVGTLSTTGLRSKGGCEAVLRRMACLSHSRRPRKSGIRIYRQGPSEPITRRGRESDEMPIIRPRSLTDWVCIQILAEASLTRASSVGFNGNHVFPMIDRFGTGYVTMDHVRQYDADPGKFNGHARRAEAPYPPTISLICTMGAISV